MRRVYLKNNLTEEEHRLTEAWIEALRSGNYKQGTGTLKTTKLREVYYCCLGVLCDIDPNIGTVVGEDYFTYKGDKEFMCLFSEYSSVLKNNKSEAKYAYASQLTALNDNGTSFYKIASLLELDLKGELTLDTYNQILQRS